MTTIDPAIGIKKLFSESWSPPLRQFLGLLWIGFLPVIIPMIFSPPELSYRINGVSQTPHASFGVGDAIGLLVTVPLYAAFITRWLRFVATGDVAEINGSPIKFEHRVWLVIWAMIRLLAIALIVGESILGASFWLAGATTGVRRIEGVWGLILVFGLVWLLARFSMILPSAALGVPMGLRESWILTRPIRTQLPVAAILAGLAATLLLSVPMMVIMPIALSRSLDVFFYAGLPLMFLGKLFGVALISGMLAVAYRSLVAIDSGKGPEIFD